MFIFAETNLIMASKIKVTIEVYNRGKGFNFRLIVDDNLGRNIIFGSNQQYENYSECLKIAKKITYAGVKPEIVKLAKYYRLS